MQQKMPRLFYGNFDFEHSLGNTPPRQLPEKLQRINAQWTTTLIPLMNQGDSLWIPKLLVEKPDDDQSWQKLIQQAGVNGVSHPEQIPNGEEIQFVPWGWTDLLIRWANEQGWGVHHPSMQTVTWANSRATSFGYEQQWESAPSGAAELKQIEDLDRLLSEFSVESKWVMKAEFSMSARERMIGQGKKVPLATTNWLKKRLKNRGRIFFEPWLNRISEMSFHYEISSTAQISFLGMTELFTDDFGRYVSNQLVVSSEKTNDTEADWSYSKSQTSKLAHEYAKQGYFGPLSIDSMRYELTDGTDRQRPLQDINARYSMGRCELERSRSS